MSQKVLATKDGNIEEIYEYERCEAYDYKYNDDKLSVINKHIQSEINDVGLMIGLSSTSKYKLAIYIGNFSLVIVYENGKGIKNEFFEIEKYILKNKTLLGYKTDYALKMIELMETHELMFYKSNLIKCFNQCIDFFKILKNNLIEMEKFEIGDIIMFDRGLYNHAAVFTDKLKFKIVHKNGEPEADTINGDLIMKTLTGNLLDKSKVLKEDFIDIMGMSKIYKNNSLDKSYPPREPQKIVEYAESKIGEIGYNITSSNCQHFASECRNGVPISEDVRKTVTYSAMIVGGLALATMAFTSFANRRKKTNENNQNNENKQNNGNKS